MSQSLLNRAPSRSTSAPSAVAAPPSLGGGRYLLGIWILLAVLTPLSGFLGARGFAPEVGVAGLLCLPLVRLRASDLTGFLLFGLLVACAVVSAFWSPAPLPHDLKGFSRFTGLHLFQQLLFSGALIVTARTLPPERARKALAWMGGGLLALTAVLLFESVTDARLLNTLQGLVGQKSDITGWALRSVAQGGYVVVMLFWPVSVAMRLGQRRYLAVAFGVGAALALVLLHMAAPLAALLSSAVVFALVARFGRPAVLVALALAVLQSLDAPWLMRTLAKDGAFAALRPHLPASWAARVDIWSFTSGRMAEKPLLGWGLDASRMFKDHIPLHPHDAPLQLWFELGTVGAVLGALAWAFIFARFAEETSTRRLHAATGCATAWCAMVIGAFSFSQWQEWWICLVALAFAACAVLSRQIEGDDLD